MISETIQQKIGEALKSRDETRLSTLRLLSSALNYERIAKQHELSSDEELAVVRREAKKRQDAIEAYEKAGAQDRADKEKKELEILREYLPKDLSDEEINLFINDAIQETDGKGRDFGTLMGVVMRKVAGRASGTKVAEMVKAKLS